MSATQSRFGGGRRKSRSTRSSPTRTLATRPASSSRARRSSGFGARRRRLIGSIRSRPRQADSRPTARPDVCLRSATPSVFHQRHFGRMLRSPRNFPGRGDPSSRDGDSRAGRCSPLWPGELRDDGVGLAAAGTDASDARLDGAFRPNDRRGEEVRRFQHPEPGRLECGARAWGSRQGSSEAEAGWAMGRRCSRDYRSVST